MVQRRLAAILVADIVGYTRLLARDEIGVLERIKHQRTAIIEPLIAAGEGRLVKLMGDGLLIEFPSVLGALGCALAWQKSVAETEAPRDPDERLCYRIGINIGEIIHDGDDIFGDGVNIAQRLEALAASGGIMVSAEAWRHAAGKIEAQAVDLGEQTLKNVPQPVRVYRIGPGPDAQAPRGGVQAEAQDRPALAVLPFANASGDPEQEYFSDGLTEDIITALSHWRSFPVIARNSSFAFKGRPLSARQIAEELGARFIVDGSIRRAGSRVRISAQLTDALTGRQVWSQRYDREIADVFELQDEITGRIVRRVVPEFEHAELARARSKPTADLGAWDCYLRGMEAFNLDTAAGQRSAVEMFSTAVERDPDYTDAWARLGWSLARLVAFGGAADAREETLARAFQAARRALALDDASAVAHLAMGSVYIWQEETEKGLAESETALDLNPNFVHAALAVGNRMDLIGRTADGVERLEHVLRLSPRDPNRWRYLAYLARAYISLGDPETAAGHAREALRLRPDLPEALFRCAVCVAHAGAEDEARALIERCEALDPDYLASRADWQPYPDPDRNDHLLSAIRALGLLPAPQGA